MRNRYTLESGQVAIIDKILDIRVRDKKNSSTIPLNRRSKGFQWFFSFVIWFSKIRNSESRKYILLLDEPGLSLHATAQNDLLKFIDSLAIDYQIIYSTHSPFMIDSSYLHRARTVFEGKSGSIISSTIQEKDPNTLFPLQAALGYDIAQNLFVSKNNLLVEGPGDLIYLNLMSNILHNNKREGLKAQITIVPVGGLDKVTTFISLLRGSKLNIVCLLDSFNDQKGRQKMDDLIKSRIIKGQNIKFFDEYANIGPKADIEDVFLKDEFIKIFNHAFLGTYKEIKLEDLDTRIPNILIQINKFLNINHFNHYTPAYKLNQLSVNIDYFSEETISRFEKIFKDINKLI